MHAYMYTSMKCMCMHVYLHMYIYIYIYLFIYLYMYMYIFLPRVLRAFFAAVCCWPEGACHTSRPVGRACRVRAGTPRPPGCFVVFRVAGAG